MKIVYYHIWHSSSFNWSNLDSRWPSRVGKTRPVTEIADFGSTSCHTTSSFGCQCWLLREVFNLTFGFWLLHSWIWHLLSMQSIEHRFCFTQGCSFFGPIIGLLSVLFGLFLDQYYYIFLFTITVLSLCLWMSFMCSFYDHIYYIKIGIGIGRNCHLQNIRSFFFSCCNFNFYKLHISPKRYLNKAFTSKQKKVRIKCLVCVYVFSTFNLGTVL